MSAARAGTSFGFERSDALGELTQRVLLAIDEGLLFLHGVDEHRREAVVLHPLDAARLVFTNKPEASEHLSRHYRRGWRIKGAKV